MKSARFTVLVAIDDSRGAEAAVQTVVRFPWPEETRVYGVVALRAGYAALQSPEMDKALDRSLRNAAAAARDALAARWSTARVKVVDDAPQDAILGEAKRVRADVIVLGWRGHGRFPRLLAGSVSRAVAARAGCSVLVARAVPESLQRFVIGYDGGVNARRALQLLSRLQPGRGMRAVLVKVANSLELPARSSRLPAALLAKVRRGVSAVNAERHEQAAAMLASAAARLKGAGWTAKTDIRAGSPLDSLLRAVGAHHADVLVLGAREKGSFTRALLGSVAEGALNHSHVPVLLVR